MTPEIRLPGEVCVVPLAPAAAAAAANRCKGPACPNFATCHGPCANGNERYGEQAQAAGRRPPDVHPRAFAQRIAS